MRAIDPRLNRDALGAEVRVEAGGQARLRLVHAAGSYLSSGPAGTTLILSVPMPERAADPVAVPALAELAEDPTQWGDL